MMEVRDICVSIVRFVDEHQPGFVACELKDAAGRLHTFIDKGPIFSSEDVWVDSVYPQPGTVRCEIIARFRDQSGRELIRINTGHPWNLESVDGVTDFVVDAGLLLPQS